MDAAAPALLVGQAVGRIGNYFNQEPFSSGWGTIAGSGRRASSPSTSPGYSAFRVFEETLRVDPAHQILGLRPNF